MRLYEVPCITEVTDTSPKTALIWPCAGVANEAPGTDQCRAIAQGLIVPSCQSCLLPPISPFSSELH